MAWDNLLDIVDTAIVASTGLLQWGQSVEYRTADGTATVNAARQGQGQTYEDQGVWVRDIDVMWYIRTGDLVLDGTAIDPKRGDVLYDGVNMFDYYHHDDDPDGTMRAIGFKRADI